MPWYFRLTRIILICLYALFFAGVLQGSTLVAPTNRIEAVRQFTRPDEFDYVNWTLDALGGKLAQASLNSPFYFSEKTRHQIVLDYLQLIDTILKDENKLDLTYSDPSVKDPAKASEQLRSELSGLYARQDQIGPLAEAILQQQVAVILTQEGLTTGGQPIPPVLFHLTPLPYNLVVSPRTKIQQDASISLLPDLTVDQQAVLEDKIDRHLNVSSLVVPIGGIGSYPTMIERTTALDWLADTISHEWTHNWLTLRPRGLNYDTSPQLRTMNETTADIVGHEVGLRVLERYYPERVTLYVPALVSLPVQPAKAIFNFNAEMHTTRVKVDALLAAGQVTEAESYMEQRRLFFWQNGYPIRKLNQAYFAFYGAYADIPGGAAGEDPVGPAVRALRQQSSSLLAFMDKISRMTSFKQLQATLSAH
jgi:hypothetical protein